MELNLLQILSLFGGKSKLAKILRAYREIYNPSCKDITMKRRLIWALEELKNNNLIDYQGYSHRTYHINGNGYLKLKLMSNELSRERMRIEEVSNQLYLQRIKGET